MFYLENYRKCKSTPKITNFLNTILYKKGKNISESRKLNTIILYGGGFKTISYAGQIAYLFENELISSNTICYTYSFGAMWSATLLFGRDIFYLFCNEAAKYCVDIHNSWISNWGKCGNIFRILLQKTLPEDISIIQNRLYISVTILTPLPKQRYISRFNDKQDLINNLIATMYIPGWTDKKVIFKYKGEYYMDGLLTHKLNKLREKKNSYVCEVITVSPFTKIISIPKKKNIDNYLIKEINRGYQYSKKLNENL